MAGTGLFRLVKLYGFFIILCCPTVFAQKAATVSIEFDKDSKRIDFVTGSELPNYILAVKGSFQFFAGRLDEPEDVVRYFHDGKRAIKVENLLSMEKFQKSHAMWRLKFRGRRKSSPQYIPRIRTLAVSFIPLHPSTGETERRVYLLLDDLSLIEWDKDKK